MTTPDPWTLIEPGLNLPHNRHYEALFALGSGPLQQRAAFEEGLRDAPQDSPETTTRPSAPPLRSRVGTYMPGVTGPHPTAGDELINLPAIHGLVLFCAGERLDMQHCRVESYHRELDLRTARLRRSFDWHTRGGAVVRVRFERLLSARRRHVMVLRCIAEHVAGPPAELRIIGSLDAEVRTNGYDHFTSTQITGEHEPITLTVQTNSDIEVAAAALLASDRPIAWNVDVEPRWVGLAGTCILDPGQRVRVDKFAAMTSSRHISNAPLDGARQLAWDAATAGYERIGSESDGVWRERWDKTDVLIDGPPEDQRGLRASIYHLLRAAVEDDARCSIDTRAASGETHRGRTFWDTDIFMLPMFVYTRPAVARTLARFRHVTLDGARRNAARQGYRGARYAWESTPAGDEHCPDWASADHEVHATADVAYGVWHAHLALSNDTALLAEACELLTETARYWCDRVTLNQTTGQYELLMVVGPDEYTPFCRNNAYTNRVAAFNLSLAAFAWQKLERLDPDAHAVLSHKLELAEGELARFAGISANMHMPYDERRQLVLQAEDFFAREPFDFDRWWPDRSTPAAACVSQERLYRSQVLKQADALQLIALFPQEFTLEQATRAYDAYAPLTTHDACLSHSVHALIAAWIGRLNEAYKFWQRSVNLNLDPPNAVTGVHAGCAGGNWQATILGFAGLRTRMQSEVLHIDPHLPAAWRAMRFPFVWQQQPLYIAITPQQVTIEHRGTEPVPALISGQPTMLEPGQHGEFDLVRNRD